MKTINQDKVIDALSRHIGREKAIRARDLVVEITGRADSPAGCRRLRRVIELLRQDGSHICGHPSIGYYLAADDEDVAATCEFLYARAMTSLSQICRMKRIAMPDIRGQLKLRI
jgi:hypothetical protein